jgi:NTE family protein
LSELESVARSLDYRKFADRDLLSRLTGPFGEALSLLVEKGLFEGSYLRDWLRDTLAQFGVRTFGDLRLPPDPGGDLPPRHRYSLVVTVSDVSRRRLVLLPWDYRKYALDPDEQPVADAVRASASIPFFFEPVRMRPARADTDSLLVDGGMLSNFPIAVFDRTDGQPPRWPTFGVKLSGHPGTQPVTHEIGGPLSLAIACVETMFTAGDAAHVDEPCVQRRTMFVDTSGVSAVDFGLSPAKQRLLRDNGAHAAHKFLRHWDFAAYLAECRGGAP